MQPLLGPCLEPILAVGEVVEHFVAINHFQDVLDEDINDELRQDDADREDQIVL